MSIETLIKAHIEALLANTEAVKLLTAAMAGGAPVTPEKPKTEKAPAKVEEKKEQSKADEIDPEAAAAHAAESVYDREDDEDDADQDSATDPVQYETVRALVLKLAPTQRDAIKALNATHGLSNAKDMLNDANDFTSVKDQAKLEAYYADLQALEG